MVCSRFQPDQFLDNIGWYFKKIENIFFFRPILIVGPFSQSILEKLCSDHPSKFVHSQPEYMNSDLKTVEKVRTVWLTCNLVINLFLFRESLITSSSTLKDGGVISSAQPSDQCRKSSITINTVSWVRNINNLLHHLPPLHGILPLLNIHHSSSFKIQKFPKF